jgi:PAS domain S-box-containing protein
MPKEVNRPFNHRRNVDSEQGVAVEKMSVNNSASLTHSIEKIHGRLARLCESANASPAPSPELLPNVLMELGIVSEALQMATKELKRQNETLFYLQNKVKAEQTRYKSVLELVSDGFLVTNKDCLIEETNNAVSELLNVPQQSLIGKSLFSLIYGEDRALFQAKLSQLAHRNRVELSVRVRRQHAEYFNAALTVNIDRTQDQEAPVYQWLLRDVTERKRAEVALESSTYNLCQNRSVHSFIKGDTIPLETQQIWVIAQGAIKLTTMSDRGEEMLIGIIRENMIFGPSLTSLQIYQASALSKVKLVSISLTEIIHSPQLAQALLPAISQRLRQTESFLSIYGQIHVEDRLNNLLLLLKREMGESVEKGTRLCVRLTHQDIANTCCTTRVTITRLLGKLQQEGKVAFDAQNHLILKE